MKITRRQLKKIIREATGGGRREFSYDVKLDLLEEAASLVQRAYEAIGEAVEMETYSMMGEDPGLEILLGQLEEVKQGLEGEYSAVAALARMQD